MRTKVYMCLLFQYIIALKPATSMYDKLPGRRITLLPQIQLGETFAGTHRQTFDDDDDDHTESTLSTPKTFTNRKLQLLQTPRDSPPFSPTASKVSNRAEYKIEAAAWLPPSTSPTHAIAIH